jgi:hypothetical protein
MNKRENGKDAIEGLRRSIKINLYLSIFSFCVSLAAFIYNVLLFSNLLSSGR